jgi:hypothetical protein
VRVAQSQAVRAAELEGERACCCLKKESAEKAAGARCMLVHDGPPFAACSAHSCYLVAAAAAAVAAAAEAQVHGRRLGRSCPTFQRSPNKFSGQVETGAHSMNQKPGETCPPRMSDGRSFTEYIPGCQLVPPTMTSNQARAHLVANAEGLIRRNREMAFHNGCTMACFDPSTTTGTALPELSYMSCDARRCEVVPGVASGLGMGRHAKSSP